MAYIDLKEAQSQLPDLVKRAAQGEEIVIVEDDQPRVQLVAAQEPRKKRTPGTAKGLIEIAEDFEEPLDDFREGGAGRDDPDRPEPPGGQLF